MRLKPRHYILLLLVLGLGIFNVMRLRHRAATATSATVIPAHLSGPVPQSAAWTAFDKAAAHRDAEDMRFQADLTALKQAIDGSNAVSVPPTTTPDQIADLHGCQTWLLFYRQEHLHPAINKPGWHDQVARHVESCVAEHRDTAA